jgi:probable Rubsico expression protein CbbX
MSFTGRPGTGKTTVAKRISQILHRLGYLRKGHVVTVTRDDLVGQYVGHTAPKTREMIKRALGGVLFIDEAYYLYKSDNERDYGSEAIEILLQDMERQRADFVVIFAGYKDRMARFYESNPGLSSRVAHHIDFPDYSEHELMEIALLLLTQQDYHFSESARDAFRRYIQRRRQLPFFANARSIRNALDRLRLRQANRLFSRLEQPLSRDDLTTIEIEDVLASRVFQGEIEGQDPSQPLTSILDPV